MADNEWESGGSHGDKYYNAFTYDASGNILTQVRHDENGAKIDDLTYRYAKNAGGKLVQNRLYHVNDVVADGNYSDDIDDMGTFTSTLNNINTHNNFSYDGIGQLVKDSLEEIEHFVWRTDGKPKEIIRYSGSSRKNLKFDYNSLGQRVAKHIYDNSNNWEKSVYYVHDARGKTICEYEHKVDGQTITFTQTDRHIHGISRIGTEVTQTELISASPYDSTEMQHVVGNKHYHLTNHLSSVVAVISDKKIPIEDGQNPGEVEYFEPELITSVDYSPGGVQLSGRTWDSQRVKYGYSSMLKDDEIKGAGNSYDFGARMYDTRLVVWHNLDQMYMKYPARSPYSYAANNPIFFVDPDGNDIEGFEVLLKTKSYAFVLGKSTKFLGYVSQFQSTTSGEIVDESKGDGIYKDINLTIAVFPRDEPNEKTHKKENDFYNKYKDEMKGGKRGVTMINVEVNGEWKNLGQLTEDEVKASKNAKFQLLAIVNEQQMQGEYIHTAAHEIFGHGEHFALLIKKFNDGELNLEQMKEEYEKQTHGGGIAHHKIMYPAKELGKPRKFSRFEELIEDIKTAIGKEQANRKSEMGSGHGADGRSLQDAFKGAHEWDRDIESNPNIKLEKVEKKKDE